MPEPPAPDGDRSDDVRSILSDLGLREELSQLELRIAELERSLPERRARDEAARSRQRELDLLRARVDDALTISSDSADRQRATDARLRKVDARSAEQTDRHLAELATVTRMLAELNTRVDALDRRVTELAEELDSLRRRCDEGGRGT